MLSRARCLLVALLAHADEARCAAAALGMREPILPSSGMASSISTVQSVRTAGMDTG
jgi:hypothetical protein